MKRLSEMPQVADLQEMVNLATGASAQDSSAKGSSVAWSAEDIELRLFLTHQNDHLHWRLIDGKGLHSVLIWTSSLSNLENLQGALRAELEKLKAARKLASAAVQAGNAQPAELAQPSEPSRLVARKRQSMVDLNALTSKSPAMKRLYLAVAEPMPVAGLAAKVSLLPVEFEEALQALVNDNLLTVYTSEPAQSGTLHSRKNDSSLQLTQQLRVRPGADESAWIQALATPPESLGGVRTGGQNSSHVAAMRSLASASFGFISLYAMQFNREIIDPELNVDLIEPCEEVDSQGMRYFAWRAFTPTWTLTGRAHDDRFEIHQVPATENFGGANSAANSEEANRSFCRINLATFELINAEGALTWFCDGLPISTEETRWLLKNSFRDLIRATLTSIQ